tara:strand:- start:20 stop:1108 length:1089 start_codon:yes stop_codon:yes gene_type:complete
MWKKISFFIFLTFILAFAVHAESDCIYHFYGESEGCPDCQQSKEHFSFLNDKYSDLQIEHYEVYFNLENYQLLQNYFDAYDVPEESQGIPAVFIHGSYFIGNDVITKLLENRILDNNIDSCPSLEVETVGVVGQNYPHKVLATLKFPILTNAALKENITPAALALTLILLLIFGLSKQKNKLLKLSLTFIGGIYLAYFLNSLGWFFSFYTKNYFPKIVGVLGILSGLFMLIEFFAGKKIINLEKILGKRKKYFNYWFTLLLGLVMALFTLPSLGDKYATLSDLIVLNYNRWMALSLILYYLILAILILLLLVYLGYEILNLLEHHASKKEKKEELWKKHNLGLFKFGLAIFEIILGIILLIL